MCFVYARDVSGGQWGGAVGARTPAYIRDMCVCVCVSGVSLARPQRRGSCLLLCGDRNGVGCPSGYSCQSNGCGSECFNTSFVQPAGTYSRAFTPTHTHHTHTSTNTWFGRHNKELFIPYPTYKQSVNDSQHFNPPTNIIPNNTFSPYIYTDWTSDIIN